MGFRELKDNIERKRIKMGKGNKSCLAEGETAYCRNAEYREVDR
jgi:hypothetical protein